MPDTFYAWLAGFVDGDGCLGIYNSMGYPTARLTIAQKDRAVLDYIKAQLGAGSVCTRGRTAMSKTTFSTSVMHALVFGPAHTRELCEKMLPYLFTKKAAAERILAKPKIEGMMRSNSISKHPKYSEVIAGYKAGKSAWLLSRETGVKDSTILYWVRTLGISRSYSEAQQLRRQNEARA